MEIELLYFDDCPNWRTAEARLHRLSDGRGDLQVTLRLVTSPEEAEAMQFRGSPTILVDGSDPFATGDEPVGLACRLYQTADGPAGSPTIEQLAEALDV